MKFSQRDELEKVKGNSHLFTGLFQPVCKVASPLNSSPFGIREGPSRGGGRCDYDTHDDCRGEHACKVSLG
jgi:hypothetical protein